MRVESLTEREREGILPILIEVHREFGPSNVRVSGSRFRTSGSRSDTEEN